MANCAALDETLDADVEAKKLRALPPPPWLLIPGANVRCEAEFCGDELCRSACIVTLGQGGSWGDVRAAFRRTFGRPTHLHGVGAWKTSTWDWQPRRAGPGRVYGVMTLERRGPEAWVRFAAHDDFSDPARCRCEDEGELPVERQLLL